MLDFSDIEALDLDLDLVNTAGDSLTNVLTDGSLIPITDGAITPDYYPDKWDFLPDWVPYAVFATGVVTVAVMIWMDHRDGN